MTIAEEEKRLSDEHLAASRAHQEAKRQQDKWQRKVDEQREKMRDAAEALARKLMEQGPQDVYEVSQNDVFTFTCAVDVLDRYAEHQETLDAEERRTSDEALRAQNRWAPVHMMSYTPGLTREDAEAKWDRVKRGDYR